MKSAAVCLLILAFPILLVASDNPARPAKPVRLIFIHHSSGENWLINSNGGLGIALRNANYYVSDTNYGWGPPDEDVGYDAIGDHTDIGHWWNWFRGPHSATYLDALYKESGKHCDYARRATRPPGENTIILFKSCFPNSNLAGKPTDPPRILNNPLRGKDSSSPAMTVANAKGIYKHLLRYFETRQDKLFIVITAPPLSESETTPARAANARAFNRWLTRVWLATYPHRNVAVFDFYNILTSNGGSNTINDTGRVEGNHHRWYENAVQYVQNVKYNYSAYPSDEWDSHPTRAGNRKATAEFVRLLNVYYHRWQDNLNE